MTVTEERAPSAAPAVVRWWNDLLRAGERTGPDGDASPAGDLHAWRPALLYGIGAAALFRVATLVVAWRGAYGDTFAGTIRHHPRDALLPLVQFDGLHYVRIATEGYPHPAADGTDGYLVFPPLYPLLMRAVMIVPHTDGVVAGVVVVTLLLPVMCVGLYRLVEIDLGGGVAALAVTLLLAFPSAMFLGVVYADLPTLCALVWAFLLVRLGRPTTAGVALGAAVMGKLVVAVAAVALALEAVHRAGDLRRARPALARLLVPPALAVAALCAYQWKEFGYPFQFLRQEALWDHHLAFPWTSIANGLHALDAHQVIVDGPAFLLDLLAIPLLAWAAWYQWQHGRRSYAVFAALFCVVLTLDKQLSSVDRYTLACFPLFVTAATVCFQRRWLERLVIVVSLLLAVDLTARFAVGQWAG